MVGAACLMAQEEVAPTIPQLTKDGDAFYLKGDYEAARLAFTSAWELVQQTPKDNPLRYDILKRLTSVRAAAGEFADADNWLQQAITWRENTLGQKDPKIADDLLISVSLCRGLKDFDRALVILRRVQSLHVEAYTYNSAMVADDFSRIGSVYGEQKKIDSAVNSIDAALAIRTKLGGPLDPSLISDLDRLGEYHTMTRAYDLAEAAFRHALVIRETLYGKTHADLISTVDGLAYALFGQKKYDEADPVYLRLIGLWESSVGKDHAMVAVALDKLGGVLLGAEKVSRSTRCAGALHGDSRPFPGDGNLPAGHPGVHRRANRTGKSLLPARPGGARPAEPDQRRSARTVRRHAQSDGRSAAQIRAAVQKVRHAAEENQQALSSTLYGVAVIATALQSSRVGFPLLPQFRAALEDVGLGLFEAVECAVAFDYIARTARGNQVLRLLPALARPWNTKSTVMTREFSKLDIPSSPQYWQR